MSLQSQHTVSSSAKQTMLYAKKFAKKLKAGDVLAFSGDLGSGKTTFIKGLAQGLGLNDAHEVKSPTFVLMHVYETEIPIYHFDLYRLNDGDEIDSIDLEDFLFCKDAITCVEWAEKAQDRMPQDAYYIHLKHLNENEREIAIKVHGADETRP